MPEMNDTSTTHDTIDPPVNQEAVFGKEAVAQALISHVANAAVQALGSLIADAKWDRGELTLTIAPGDIVAAVIAAKQAGYNFMEDVTCVDWYPSEPRFQVAYSLLSHRMRHRVRLVARVSGDNPTIDSITRVWPSANFYEREVFDLFGVSFAGHPRLTRIMMPDNWNGHPLRKDYPVEGYR